MTPRTGARPATLESRHVQADVWPALRDCAVELLLVVKQSIVKLPELALIVGGSAASAAVRAFWCMGSGNCRNVKRTRSPYFSLI